VTEPTWAFASDARVVAEPRNPVHRVQGVDESPSVGHITRLFPLTPCIQRNGGALSATTDALDARWAEVRAR